MPQAYNFLVKDLSLVGRQVQAEQHLAIDHASIENICHPHGWGFALNSSEAPRQTTNCDKRCGVSYLYRLDLPQIYQVNNSRKVFQPSPADHEKHGRDP